MKLNVKSLMLVLGTGIVFSLSGCGGGSSGTPADTEPGAGEVGYQVLSDDNQTITYLDQDLQERNASVTPGDAEVLAAEGYQHTLFDTAEKKCQNCHNKLFDTWKGSMHAKSWSDKVFQSKHQDFLRTHIAKIGANKDVPYTTTTFGKVGKTCAKCHAPAAIYSNDYNLSITSLPNDVTNLDVDTWKSLKGSLEKNLAGKPGYNPNLPTTVASIGKDKTLYTATYHIGHENNREGINCATCHSIETVRMMTDDGRGDGGQYKLASAIRGNVIGPVVVGAGEILYYDENSSAEDMNIFFKLVGPEKYHDVANSPHDENEYDVDKAADGRYTFRGIDKNGTDGKTHYTGGPFYGPFGVTGLGNSNEDDDTNRSAQVNPHYDKDDNNHFGDNGKALCLSCHQRSAGAIVPSGADKGDFMELCSTWTAVSNGGDTNYNDSTTSPKCQKCHMPRVDEPMVLHQWARPDLHFTQNDMHLTDHFDPDSTLPDDLNPVKGQWMNDHSFVGANKLGAANHLAKIESGFEATLEATPFVGSIMVTTTLSNKTAHMFPGAHPMRRVLTRVIVTDSNDNNMSYDVQSTVGYSSYGNVTNNVVTGKSDQTINITGETNVPVDYNSQRVITYQGQTPDLNGSTVSSQKFDRLPYTIPGPDGTIQDQFTDENATIKGTVKNAEIVETSDKTNFTRIYGRETGKYYTIEGESVYIVRPGFDSNIVPENHDNRLQPNETETYNINFTGLASGEYTVSYKVYYMQKGASGVFAPTDPKQMITVVEDLTETVTVTNPL